MWKVLNPANTTQTNTKQTNTTLKTVYTIIFKSG